MPFSLRRILVSALPGLCLLAAGCAIVPYAREVKKKPQEGGVVALRTTHSAEDRAKAESLIAANCGIGGYKILEEGEVVVGQKTHSSAHKDTDYNSKPLHWGSVTFGNEGPSESTNVASETTQVKEWQISYECSNIAVRPESKTQKVASKKKKTK